MQEFPDNAPSLAKKNYTAMRAFLRAGLRNEVEAFLQVVDGLGSDARLFFYVGSLARTARIYGTTVCRPI